MRWSAGGLVALGLLAMVASTTTANAGTAARTLADDSQVAALQQVVQHSNDEQVQAIAASNLSLVTDTVTGDYAQQLVTSLRSMLDNHVTAIALLNLQWGPASVAADGTSATITTYETWRVVSTEGSVDDEPTRNDYTLLKDNGIWKISSDTQTVGAPTPVTTDTPIVTPTVATATPSPAATDTPTPTPMPTAVSTDTPTPEAEPTQATE